MPDNCRVCVNVISRNNPGVICSGQCQGRFHLKCTKLPVSIGELPADSGLAWRCRDCRDLPPDSESLKLLKQLVTKVDSVSSEVAAMKKDRTDLMESIKFYGDKIDDFNLKLESMKSIPNKVEDLNQKLSDLKKDHSTLRAEVEFLRQRERSNNIEICGIPEKRGENVISIMKKLGEIVGVSLAEEDIVTGHRVARFPGAASSQRPKTIVLKFASADKKGELLNAVKKFRNPELMAERLALSNGSKVYINEHLSPFYKVLYKKTREFCRKHSFKYCWIRDMKIFIKRDDSSRAIFIENEDTLSKLRV